MILAVCGLLLAFLSVVLVVVYIRTVSPRTLSLAYRIDSERVLFFERTTDPIAFMRGIAAYAPLIAPAPLPSMKALPQGVSYEFAVLYPVPGRAPQWAIYVHTKEKTHVTIVSENDPQIFVPIKEINRSLGRSSFYRAHNESSAANAVYADLKALHDRPDFKKLLMDLTASTDKK